MTDTITATEAQTMSLEALAALLKDARRNHVWYAGRSGKDAADAAWGPAIATLAGIMGRRLLVGLASGEERTFTRPDGWTAHVYAIGTGHIHYTERKRGHASRCNFSGWETEALMRLVRFVEPHTLNR